MNRRDFIKGSVISFGLTGCSSYIEKVMDNRDRREGKFLQSLEKYVLEAETTYTHSQGITDTIKGMGIIFNNGKNDYYFTLSHIVDFSDGITTLTFNGPITYKPDDFKYSTKLFDVELKEFVHNKINDVAVFKIPKRLKLGDYRFPLKAREEVYPGERIAVLGNPALSGYHPRTGRITDMDGIKIKISGTDKNIYKNSIGTDIGIIGGTSGTPVISMSDKKLIGIMGLTVGHVSYFQPIKEFLKYTNESKET